MASNPEQINPEHSNRVFLPLDSGDATSSSYMNHERFMPNKHKQTKITNNIARQITPDATEIQDWSSYRQDLLDSGSGSDPAASNNKCIPGARPGRHSSSGGRMSIRRDSRHLGTRAVIARFGVQMQLSKCNLIKKMCRDALLQAAIT